MYLSPLVPEELPSVFDDLFIRQEAVRLLFAQGENLPEGHTERPHITGSGELALGVVDSKNMQKPSHIHGKNMLLTNRETHANTQTHEKQAQYIHNMSIISRFLACSPNSEAKHKNLAITKT